LFLNLCEEMRVTLIMESGVRNGVSTRIIAASKVAPLVSVDRSALRLDLPTGVTFVQGDSCYVIPRLLNLNRDKRIAVLIDGPKREVARALKDVCLQHPAVQFVALHDQCKGNGETLHSLNAEHIARTHHLDDGIPADVRVPKRPGLAIWTRAEVAA
jgi:hypothetical protein